MGRWMGAYDGLAIGQGWRGGSHALVQFTYTRARGVSRSVIRITCSYSAFAFGMIQMANRRKPALRHSTFHPREFSFSLGSLVSCTIRTTSFKSIPNLPSISISNSSTPPRFSIHTRLFRQLRTLSAYGTRFTLYAFFPHVH